MTYERTEEKSIEKVMCIDRQYIFTHPFILITLSYAPVDTQTCVYITLHMFTDKFNSKLIN